MNWPIKVLSYNIHKGMTIGNRQCVMERLRDYIRVADADVVFLQEVAGDARRTITVSQFEYLADTIWHHYAYGKNAVYASGHHGNAILSKWPFVKWHNFDISTNRFEQRGLLHGVISKGNDPDAPLCHLLCTHLNLLESGRRAQLKDICGYVKQQIPDDARLIIAGDTNDWRQRASMPLIQQLGVTEAFKQTYGHYAKTFPSILPMLPLDRIYFRHLELVSCRRADFGDEHQLSDHIPLMARFVA